MKNKIFYIIQYLKMKKASKIEIKRFAKKRDQKSRLEFLMLLDCHSLEKGMVFKNVKKGYGKKKATNLLLNLKKYIELGYEGYVLEETISILNKYIQFSDSEDAEIQSIEKEFKALSEKITGLNELAAGKTELGREFFESWKGAEPERFFETRKSIRNFEDKEVEEKDIERAISMARFAPSACNRQPVKVFYSLKKEIISKIDDLVMGNKGFEDEMKNFLVITADTNMFGLAEIYQWYVNGGIFVSHLTMALHSIGVGSCVFQWVQNNQREDELRKILDIQDKEVVVAIVGIGYYPEIASCACAARKSVSDIAIKR